MITRSNKIYQPIRQWSLLLFFVFSLLLFPTITGRADSSPFEPYIEKHSNGWIDWQNGLIYGVGRGYLDQNRSWPRAQGAADVIASGTILKLAAGINLDDQNTLESLDHGKVLIQLKAFIHDRLSQSKNIEDVSRPYCEVVRVASIKGIAGLTARLLTHLQANTPEWRNFPLPEERPPLTDDDQPWLVLDARKLGRAEQAKPALFPKIISPAGEVVHGVKSADPTAVINRGVMHYVISGAAPQNLPSAETSLEHILTTVDSFLSPPEAQAANTKRQKRTPFIVKEVLATHGSAMTNLVISANDAKHLRIEDRKNQILKNCRVIVVVSSLIPDVEVEKIITKQNRENPRNADLT